MANNKQTLFTDFPPVSTEKWMEKVTTDLKGADFEKKLVWRTNEGFNVKPMYRAEDIEGMNQTTSLPGQYPYIRGTKTHNSWLISQTIDVDCVKAANEKAKTWSQKGVTSFNFILDREAVSGQNLETLLDGICLESYEVNFKTCAKASVKLAQLFVAYVASKGYDTAKVMGSINFDPIGRKLARGKEMENMFDLYAEIINATQSLPRFKAVAVNPVYFNRAGAYSYQELGFALAWGNDLIAQLSEKQIPVALIAKKIKFNFGVGPNYFMEIAKFRAARMLWAHIVMAYSPACPNETCDNNKPDGLCKCASKMTIHAETSSFNMTLFDAHVNLLRSQTEAMSASLAGVDSLEVLPFDNAYSCSDEFSERIARNQQLLLKEESHFDKVVDPAAGSYYLENLTASLAKQAWSVVLKIEEMGGFVAAMNEGYVVTEINKSGDARRAAIAARKESLLGTNQYPNFNETAALKTAECDCSCGCGCNEKIKLNFSRGASEFEALRLETEKSGKRPKVFMLTIGNLAMRLARSQFSCNFFGCAGYELIDNLGFKTVDEGVAAAKAKGADIVVLCSSDDEYATFAPEAKAALDNQILVVAGAPACTEELKAQGITEFVNVRSNVLETLKKFNAQLLK